MTLLSWPPRRWLVVAVTAVVFVLGTGMPTDVVPNPLFSRVTPVQWWSYPILAATGILAGLVIATYVSRPSGALGVSTTAGGGLMSALAIGCPVCNKLVVALVGFSGALSVWAPLQPIIGLVSLALLGWALRTRLTGERECAVPTRPLTGTEGALVDEPQGSGRHG